MIRRLTNSVARAVRQKETPSGLSDVLARLTIGVAAGLRRVPSYLLLRELVRDPGAVGTICSSSEPLAERMAAWVDPQQEGWIIELGGGTGAITAALLKRGIGADQLIVIEKSKLLAQHLRERFPGICIIHGDAADIHTITSGGEAAAAVVSGLPMHSLSADVVSKISNACVMALGKNGRLVQFTYWPRIASAWPAAGLLRVACETVWNNLPPARVEVFTRSDLCHASGHRQ